MRILCYPNEALRLKAEKVTAFDAQLRKAAEDMLQTMYAANGVGLAAPQVGLAIRLAVFDCGDTADGEFVLVNPEIVDCQGKLVGDEGCLSFPGIFVKVQRFERVTIRYQDLDGKEQTLEADGMLARAVQHELDHLDGVLLVDKMTPVQRMANRRALKMLELRQAGGGEAFVG